MPVVRCVLLAALLRAGFHWTSDILELSARELANGALPNTADLVPQIALQRLLASSYFADAVLLTRCTEQRPGSAYRTPPRR